ncbi:MAG: DUF1330 domain-containing protein [Pseudomonadota bacterium]
MAKGYVIAQVNVTFPETYPKHVAFVQTALKTLDGTLNVRRGQEQSYERALSDDQNAVIACPRFQAASDWYHSDIYEETKALCHSVSTSVQTIVEGIA